MRQPPGFSLIELLIVLSLISLIIGLTVSNFSFLHRGLIRSEIDKLYAACMFMQRKAMVSNSVQTLQFDPAANSYQFDDHHEKLSRPLAFGFKPGAKGPPSSPHREITSPITFQQGVITFHPDGIIKPGTAYLVDSEKNFMYAISSAIAQVSFLRTYRYEHGSWELVT